MTAWLNAAHAVLIVVAITAATMKLMHARRPGANVAAVRAMCGSIIAMGIATIFNAGWVVPQADAVIGESAYYAVRHTPALLSMHLLRRAFLCWVWLPGPERSARLRRHLDILGGVLLVRWILAAIAPNADAAAALSPSSDWTHAPITAVAMLLYVAYMAWCVTSVGYLATLWSREPTTRRWTRVGLRCLVISTSALTLYLLHKVGVLVFVLGGGQLPYNQYLIESFFLITASTTLFGGLAVPLVATGVPAAVAAVRDHRHYRRVLPLWAALTAEDRHVVLRCHSRLVPDRVAPWWETLSVVRIGFRLYHRLVECADVVLRLHKYLDSGVRENVRIEAERAGHPEPFAAAVADAVMIRDAFRRRQHDTAPLPASQRSTPLADQDSISLARNVQWWLSLAEAWNSPVAAQAAERAGVTQPAVNIRA